MRWSIALAFSLASLYFLPLDPIVAAPSKGGKSSTSKQGANKTATPTKPAASKLYGRIDQLFNSQGATIPKGVFKSETPMYDNTPPSDNKTPNQTLTGFVTNSFPTEWKGTWSGYVNVVKFADNPICWRGDALEMYGIRRINKPGRPGKVSCTFKSDDGIHLNLDPPTILMSMNMMRPSLTDIVSAATSDTKLDPSLTQLDGESNLRGELRMPLGSAVSYKNVNGNPVSMQVLKNELRELDANTMEQDVLVQMDEYNNLMSRLSNSYNETVLRFTADGDELDLEIAQVSYDASGAFLSKTIFSGKLSKAPGK